MPYCNWCHLDSDSEDFCVWCKRPFSSGPSLFNLPKKNDIHFLAAEDDSSDLQVPVFAFLGVLVFVGILIFAWFNLRRNQTVAQVAPQVTDVGELKPTQPRALNTGEEFRISSPGGQPNAVAPSINSSPAIQGPATRPDTSYTETWRGGQSAKNYIVQAVPIEPPKGTQASSIYFESAKFQVQTNSKGMARLFGDLVVVNDKASALTGGRLWLKIGGMKLNLHRFAGKIDAPHDLGPINVPAKSSLECYVYVEGFTKSINLKPQKVLGLDAEVEGTTLSVDSEISS